MPCQEIDQAWNKQVKTSSGQGDVQARTWQFLVRASRDYRQAAGCPIQH
jgi:hypothetical protein